MQKASEQVPCRLGKLQITPHNCDGFPPRAARNEDLDTHAAVGFASSGQRARDQITCWLCSNAAPCKSLPMKLQTKGQQHGLGMNKPYVTRLWKDSSACRSIHTAAEKGSAPEKRTADFLPGTLRCSHSHVYQLQLGPCPLCQLLWDLLPLYLL